MGSKGRGGSGSGFLGPEDAGRGGRRTRQRRGNQKPERRRQRQGADNQKPGRRRKRTNN